MDQLLTFFGVAIALPLGVLALCKCLTPREEIAPEIAKELSPETDASRWGAIRELHTKQQHKEATQTPVSLPARRPNPPLLIVIALVSLVALACGLSTLPIWAVGLILVTLVILNAVIFAHEPEGTVRSSSDAAPTDGKVNFTDLGVRQPIGPETGLSAEAQAARQPAPPSALQIPASQQLPQGEWTAECDFAVAALVSLKIPKRKAIDLVRQSPGRTLDEILRHSLQIHGRGNFPPAGTNGRAHS